MNGKTSYFLLSKTNKKKINKIIKNYKNTERIKISKILLNI